MTVLEWDQVGDRRFETGVDRCVLYLSDGRAVAWNGVTSVDEQSNRQSESLYLDGVKFLERQILGDFSGSLRAYTYPEEFEEVLGLVEVLEGLSYHDQPAQIFSLCYRTRIGNDVDGVDHGYRIHILYNLLAVPDSISYQSVGDQPTPTDFGWTLKGTPTLISGYRPTVHISIDSTTTDPERLAAIEEVLYGTAGEDPELPDITDITALFETFNDLYIVDNGDGTWTANDPGDNFITMVDATTFSIDGANTTVVDANTYTISNTDLDD